MTDPHPSLSALIAKWRDPEFWKDDGCRMDSRDCADDLEALLPSLALPEKDCAYAQTLPPELTPILEANERLRARVQELEHRIYVEDIGEGRITVSDHTFINESVHRALCERLERDVARLNVALPELEKAPQIIAGGSWCPHCGHVGSSHDHACEFEKFTKLAAGRLASGDPTRRVFEDVRVECRKCGGVTVFPVLIDAGVRPTPAPCLHCGAEI